ncbi:hypothetical protein [Streptomyces glaucus]|uniref:Secreted protein n=1 Tax=Streptomyces glaucus TaxID=284029 RepID=A0ABN3KGU7_9ACTN
MHRPHTPDLGSPRPVPDPDGRCGRLPLPPHLSASLGYDAVGTPRELGGRIMERLPRVGCVFADDLRWWWIVPAGSQIGVTWPPSTGYAVGAHLADPSWTSTRPKPGPGRPHLIHAPEAGEPYTPPIPLYLVICRLTGSAPRWSLSAAS